MAYPFVKGISYGERKGPVKAFVIHMAEGGNTVAYLRADATPPARGVSVHYVIEYSGRTVQMVHEADASGSINPASLRTTNGPAPYGAAVRRRVMGLWDHDPNAAAISVEIEGFAAAGPNPAQQAALIALVKDVRSRYPDMGLLGHRDFQDYKPCPGGHIDWTALGGHGEGTMRLPVTAREPLLISFGVGVQLYTPSGDKLIKTSVAQVDRWSPYEAMLGTSHYRVTVVHSGGIDQMVLVHNPDVTTKPIPAPAVDCSAQDAKIAEAIAVLS